MAWEKLFEEAVPKEARGKSMLVRVEGEEIRAAVPARAILAIVEVNRDKNARRVRFELDESEPEPEKPEEKKPERSSIFWLD